MTLTQRLDALEQRLAETDLAVKLFADESVKDFEELAARLTALEDRCLAALDVVIHDLHALQATYAEIRQGTHDLIHFMQPTTTRKDN